MKQVFIEPTLKNQANDAYKNPMFTVIKVKVQKYEFSPTQTSRDELSVKEKHV